MRVVFRVCISVVCLVSFMVFPVFAFQTDPARNQRAGTAKDQRASTARERQASTARERQASLSDQAQIWFEHERGWFWYEIIPPQGRRTSPLPQEPKPQKPKSQHKVSVQEKPHKENAFSYTEILEQIRQALAEIKARAVLFPTPENVAAWYQAQLMISRMAGSFTQVAMRIPVLYPELDIASQLGGQSQLGMLTMSYARRKEEEQALKEVASSSILVLVYRSPGCFLCKREAQEVIKAARNDPFKTYALYEGEPPPGMDRVRPLTPEIERMLDVKTFPTLYLFRNKKFYYLGAGFLGQEDIRNRVFLVAKENKWINPKPFYLVENKEYTPQEVVKILRELSQNGYMSHGQNS